jgi:hypothetical protein
MYGRELRAGVIEWLATQPLPILAPAALPLHEFSDAADPECGRRNGGNMLFLIPSNLTLGFGSVHVITFVDGAFISLCARAATEVVAALPAVATSHSRAASRAVPGVASARLLDRRFTSRWAFLARPLQPRPLQPRPLQRGAM